jgi:CBS domain-containing protein
MKQAALSEILSFQALSARGALIRVTDLAIQQLDVDYPPVTRLVLRTDRHTEVLLPWEAVRRIDWPQRLFHIGNDEQAEEIDPAKQMVLLRRDILDALILDLRTRRVTRANDLWLEEEDGQLRLSAADTGVTAILRRITRGRYRGNKEPALYDWKYIEFLRGDPQAVDRGAGYHRRIVHLPPGEIAHLAASMPYLHAAELLELLPDPLAADTLEVMSLERQLQVFEELDEDSASHILTYMAPDLAADILGRVETDLARRYLNRLPRKAAERIIELLRYPENSVGGIMANDVVTLFPHLTIGKARPLLRKQLKDPDFVYFIYVVDEQPPHRLRGVVSLRQILVAEDEQKVEELMNPYLITLSPFDSPDEAGYRLLSSQLAALPVVGNEGQLLGSVTIDAAVSQVAPRSWRAQAPRVFS